MEKSQGGAPEIWAQFAENLKAGWSWSGFETSAFFVNDGAARFSNVASVIGADQISDGRALAAGDLDGDGDVDLVGSVSNVRPMLYVLRNDLREQGNSLFVELVGSGGTSAAGASLRVRGGGRVLRRDVALGSGFLTQHDLTQHFGLGEAERVEGITITWPDGAVQELGEVRANGKLVVEQGGEVRAFAPRIPRNANATGRLPAVEWDRRSDGRELLRPPYPDLSDLGLRDLEGEPIDLVLGPEGARPGGPVLLLNLWAGWCASCKREMPALVDAHAAAPEGLRIVGVNLDTEVSLDEVRRTADEWRIDFPVAHLTGARFEHLMERLEPAFGRMDPRAMVLPTSLLLTPSGKVIAKIEGELAIDDLVDLIRSLRER